MYLIQFKPGVWDKLKHEWKTATIALVGTIVEFHDALIATNLVNIDPLVPVLYQPWVHVAWPVLMLAFRRWRDKNVIIINPPKVDRNV